MRGNFLSFFKNMWNISFFRKSSENSFGFFSSKLSKWKFIILSYFAVTLTFCPYLRHMNSDFMELNSNAFFYYFFSLSFANFFIFSKFVNLKEYKVDLSLNFISLCAKNITLLISLIRIKFSKFFIFLSYKLKKSSYILNFFKSHLSNFYILWRPLFKRLSYFGNFKLTRSKFNNLK